MSETTGLTIPEMLDRILENQCALLWVARFGNTREPADDKMLENYLLETRKLLEKRGHNAIR